MQKFSLSPKVWFTALGIIVLAAGLAIAYLVKTQAFEGDAAHYHIVGDQVYTSQSADTKEDADVLRKYGGNAAIIAAAYKRKLHNLLREENLGYLLAIAAVILAAACFRAAWESDDPD
jgi:hypothetical protein